MIFYTNRFIPKGAAACARGPFIFIRPEYRGDAGLLAHERVHVWQAWRGLLIAHALCYLMSDKYKLECEVEAYREQAMHYPDDRLPKFARFISERYGLRISTDEALKLLRQESSR